jgi:hypothetical protein
VQGIKHFRPYLLGKDFTLITDHSALKWLQNHKGENTRLLRWALVLQGYYPFDIQWRPGLKHSNSDCLSRFPMLDTINALVIDNLQDIREKQQEDIHLKKYFNYLINQTLPPGKTEARKIVNECLHLAIDEGVLYHIWNKQSDKDKRGRLKKRTVIPKSLIPEVLKLAHDEAGHYGLWKTVAILKERVHWNSMVEDTAQFCQRCDICQRTKFSNQKPHGKMETMDATEPWEMICVDWVGPIYPEINGYKYILVIVDYFTRWVEAFPSKNKSAQSFVKILNNEVLSRYMMPRKLLSDRDPAFLGKVTKELLKIYGIDKVNTSAYHAQTNMTERCNKQIIQVMKALVLQYQRDWTELLPTVLQKLRIHVNETTKKSPYEMLFGRLPRIPLDLVLGRVEPKSISDETVKQLARIHKRAKVEADKAKLRHKIQYDKKRQENKLALGDLVLWKHTRLAPQGDDKKVPKKFRSNVYGPFRIIGNVSKNTYRLQDTQTGEIIMEAVNADKLQRYFEKYEDKPSEIETMIDESPFIIHSSSSSSSSSEEDEPVRHQPHPAPPPIPDAPLPAQHQQQLPDLPSPPSPIPDNDLPTSDNSELSEETHSDNESDAMSHDPSAKKSEKIKAKQGLGMGYSKVGKSDSKWLQENQRFMMREKTPPEPKTTRSGARFGPVERREKRKKK